MHEPSDFDDAQECHGPPGYHLLEELIADQSWSALAVGNRRVVLKRLDPDCVLRGGTKLHPSIRDRLTRVRELAHPRVANLHGVERDAGWQGGAAYLIWDFVEGQTFEDWATQPHVSARELLLIARELILTVEALHGRGIVHGAIHGRNIIIDPAGRLQLTHISPLLYTETQNDLDAISALFEDIAAARGERESPLDQLAREAAEAENLRALSARATLLIDSRKPESRDDAELAADIHRRRRSQLAAALVVLAALVATYGIKHAAAGRWSDSPPPPPRASEEAMSP